MFINSKDANNFRLYMIFSAKILSIFRSSREYRKINKKKTDRKSRLMIKKTCS